MHLQVRQASHLEILRAHTILTSPQDPEELKQESTRKMRLLQILEFAIWLELGPAI